MQTDQLRLGANACPLHRHPADNPRCHFMPLGGRATVANAEAIADELAMHPRTLQRRLADEGMGCQDIIDRERRAQDARYFAERGLHLSQIAGLLGLRRTERAQPLVPALVRQDAATVPDGNGARVVGTAALDELFAPRRRRYPPP